MARLDMYVQHLVKHHATHLVLASGQPVKFRFPSGDRHSNSVVAHNDLAQLVQEVGPRDAMAALMRTGRAEFEHKTDDGTDVHVVVEALNAGSWTVTVSPASAAVAAEVALPPPPATPRRHSARPPAAPAETPAAVPAAASSHRRRSSSRVSLAPGEPAINRYLRLMVKVGASDLHLSSDQPALVRLHGEMQPLEPDAGPLDDAALRALLLPIASPRAATAFETTNDADFAHTIVNVARFRVNYFIDRKGMGAVFRQIPFEILSPEKLGIPKQVLDLCWLSKGLVLATGPTGSGKSTTLATLIDYVNSNRQDHILTIEDPIEFVHENKKCLVNQREIGTHTASFKSGLRAALREDPDVVLVGEMRDLETIAIAIETAETGHLVFGTLHTTSAPSTIDRIIDQFPADRQEQIRSMLSESIKGVISQVLCKKKGGGRIAAYEVLIGGSAVSNLIREGKTFQLVSVMQTGKTLGMQTMNEHLIELVKTDLVEAKEAYIKSNDKVGMKELFKRNNIKLDLA